MVLGWGDGSVRKSPSTHIDAGWEGMSAYSTIIIVFEEWGQRIRICKLD